MAISSASRCSSGFHNRARCNRCARPVLVAGERAARQPSGTERSKAGRSVPCDGGRGPGARHRRQRCGWRSRCARRYRVSAERRAARSSWSCSMPAYESPSITVRIGTPRSPCWSYSRRGWSDDPAWRGDPDAAAPARPLVHEALPPEARHGLILFPRRGMWGWARRLPR